MNHLQTRYIVIFSCKNRSNSRHDFHEPILYLSLYDKFLYRFINNDQINTFFYRQFQSRMIGYDSFINQSAGHSTP